MSARDQHLEDCAATKQAIEELQAAIAVMKEKAETALGLAVEATGSDSTESASVVRAVLANIMGIKADECMELAAQGMAEMIRYEGGF